VVSSLVAVTVTVAALAVARSQAQADAPAAGYLIKPVGLADVRITNGFWKARLDVNRAVTIPHIIAQNELTGRIDNFLKAAHKMDGAYKGQRYNDTDVYKVIEAASYSLVGQPDPALDRKLDEIIAIVAAAQEPDGYLYTPRTVDPKNPAPGAGPERWSYLHTSHELYDMGHMIEAAVAHHQATGKRTFLDVAVKAADLICRQFGPDRMRNAPGHEEIELALVKLSRETGDRKYLEEAKFFLDERGRQHSVPPVPFEPGSRFAMYNDLAYRQDHRPVVEQTRATGHAVRATYMYNGMTDVAALLGDSAFGRTVEAAFRDVAGKRMYVTGGLGSDGRTEAFGDDFVLPNRAYAETCASIGGMLWYHRMFLKSGDASYMDVFERTLYNGYLSGVSLAGNTFFYQNPLVSDGRPERQTYFDVACCPANLARLISQLPSLIYAERNDTVYVNLFVGSEAKVRIGDTPVTITQTTDYPWDSRVTLRLNPERPVTMTLAIRMPGWSRNEAVPSDLYRFAGTNAPTPSLTIAENRRPGLNDRQGYAIVSRAWRPGDTVTIELPMTVRRVLANDGVVEDRGKAAIERGPVVYCIEAADHGGKTSDVSLPLDAELSAAFRSDLLGGVTVVTGQGRRAGTDVPITAVPYFAWNNRGRGDMAVWIPVR
jgi:uncharacterized protein